MDHRWNFFREPMGFLNIDTFLGRCEEIISEAEPAQVEILFDRYVRTVWPSDIWDCISEDAERLDVSQAQVIVRIVREHYERERCMG